MEDRFYEMYEMQRDRANKLEEKLNQIKEILDEDVYLGTMGNRIKYEILEVIEPKEDEIERLNNIIKEVREYLKVREYETECCEVCNTMSNKILEILNKGE